MKNQVIHTKYSKDQASVEKIINEFSSSGEVFGNQNRNTIKLFDLNGLTVNVKSFKKPNLINQIAYRFFRKSKAERSYEYANRLLDLNIGTPQPIAYFEFGSIGLFKNSYYVSEQLECLLTYRELVTDPDFPNHEAILRAFTRFTYELHQKGVFFLDHSPGNTLITNEGNEYQFYLVDLNRMKFQEMSFDDRMKNFSRLSPKKEMVAIMSDEYSKISDLDYDKVFNEMWSLTEAFQEKFHKKRRLKKKLKFWKKN